MVVSCKIKVGKRHIPAFLINLSTKNLIIFRGTKGYVMCGYLNLGAANKFNDVAIKIIGVSSIKEALGAKVHSLSQAAKRLGIYKNQSIREVLKVIV